MAATLKDIARKLNLSVSTVSYALNGGPKPVSDEVREDVARVARELGYMPNRVARALVTRSNRTIGFVPPRIERGSLLGAFVQLSLNAIVNAAEDRHYDILLLTAYDRTHPDQVASVLGDSRIDGVVLVAPPSEQATFRILHEHGLPFAVVGSGFGDQVPQFRPDEERAVRTVMDHLWNYGHRRIAHVAGRPTVGDARERAEGYRCYLREKGQPVHEDYIYWGTFCREDGQRAFHHFQSLESPPTAIFCANDEMAIGLMEEAVAYGLNLPDDLSVVGFDDAADAKHASPPLTTVHQPIDAMATAAFEAVLNQLESGAPCLGAIFSTTLIVRRSVSYAKD